MQSMTLWNVNVLVANGCLCWHGFAATPAGAAQQALARWSNPAGARAEVREPGARRKSPLYVGW